MVLFHFLLAYAGVGGAAEKYHPIRYPPKERFHFTVPVGGQHSLGARFRRTGDVVGQRRRHLNLQTRHVPYGETENAPSNHHGPKGGIPEARESQQRGQFTVQQHQR